MSMWAERLSVYLMRVLVFCIPIQLGLHFWPQWALFLGRRIDYLSPTLYLTDCLAFSAMIFYAFARVRFQKFKRLRSKKNIVYGVLILIVFSIAVLNIFNAISWQVSVYRWIKVALFGFVTFYVATHKSEAKHYLQALVAGALFSSVLAVAQFVKQQSIGSIFWFVGERLFSINTPLIARGHVCMPFTESCTLMLRPYATFAHPNLLGGYLSVALFLLIAKIRKNRVHIFTIAAMIFLGIALLLTMSRAAIVVASLLFIWRYAFFIRDTPHLFTKWIVVVPFFMIIVSLFFVLPFSSTDESILVRTNLNFAATRVIANHWALGVGLGNFVLSLKGIQSGVFFATIQPVHNVYLLALAELGLVGIVGLIGAAGILWRTIKHKMIRMNKDASLYAASLAALGAIGLFDHYMWTLQQGQLLTSVFIGLYISSRVPSEYNNCK